MAKNLVVLCFATTAFWVVVAGPALWLGIESALLHSLTAALVCVIPAAITLAWTARSFHGQPESQLIAVLGGTGVRMAMVLGAAMVLYQLLPAFGERRFWLWVIVFYLFTLAAEVALLSRQMASELTGKQRS